MAEKMIVERNAGLGRKLGVCAGVLLVLVVWAWRWPLVMQLITMGLVRPLTALFLLVALGALLTGAIMVLVNRRGLIPMALHIVFASLAFIDFGTFLPALLTVGILFALVAMLWPAPKRVA